jgi:hypothetical protein
MRRLVHKLAWWPAPETCPARALSAETAHHDSPAGGLRQTYVPPIIARLEGTGGRCRVSMKSEPNEENKPTLNTKLRISSSPQGIPPSSVSTTHRPHGARLPTQIKHFRDEAKIIVKFCIQLPSIIANRNDVDLSNHRNSRRDPTAPKPGVRRCWLSSKVSLAEPRSLA